MLWVVFGAIFAGGVHDYFSGMLSVRNRGASIAEVVGDSLGTAARQVMRFFSVLLLVLVGVVFVLSPATLLSGLTGWGTTVLVLSIFGYYFLATIVPVHRLIGRLYPVFGALLLFMTLGILWGLLASGHTLGSDVDLISNRHPDALPLWPMLFVVLSCGAISGFHSTQSPLMARCLRNERHGRLVFYGAMIGEGMIALVWVAVGVAFYESAGALHQVIAAGSPSLVVDQVSRALLGPVGGVLAILGVVILPITSGDTAFRSARLVIADTFGLQQRSIPSRLAIAIPLFGLGYLISLTDFDLVWRYFGWANQTLAMLVLWTAAIWLAQRGPVWGHWIATLPATFMTAVSVTFLLYAPIGLGLPYSLAVGLGLLISFAVLVVFLTKLGCFACERASSAETA
jgi:carbon starvation protein CstA